MWGWGRARAQQGGGRWTMLFLCVSSTWATGIILDQRRCWPTSEWLCGVLCFVTRKFMKGLHSDFLRWDNWTPLGSETFILGNLSSFLLLFWHCQFDHSWFMYLQSWASIATGVSSGMAAAAQREWTGKEPDLVINCMTAFVKEERQERGIFLWAFF